MDYEIICHILLPSEYNTEHRYFSRSSSHYSLIPLSRRISHQIQLLSFICVNKRVVQIHVSQLHFWDILFTGLCKSILSFLPKFILKAIF